MGIMHRVDKLHDVMVLSLFSVIPTIYPLSSHFSKSPVVISADGGGCARVNMGVANQNDFGCIVALAGMVTTECLGAC